MLLHIFFEEMHVLKQTKAAILYHKVEEMHVMKLFPAATSSSSTIIDHIIQQNITYFP